MKRVLIVDDAAFMRLTLKNILVKNGFEVIGEAVNGAMGVSMYKELHPDIVTMDITMPEMTGLEALKEIKTYDPNAKIVMISAMGQGSMVMEAVEAGAKTFIVKPFKEDYVVEVLTKISTM
ncbi:MAG: response regulator [Clostridia bacterium]|nr:response regulator [Clostridia bacterium]MDD4145759.1 response regulator [Clostridia bacterium]MDD4665400.1 response regulator [Clostridia bacterium]